jgi:ankyrin repeat protein
MCRECDQFPIHRMLRDTAGVTDDEIIEHINEFCDINFRSPCGKTPLMTLAYYGRKELIEKFSELGAVMFAQNEKTGDTAAHYAMLSVAVGHVRQCSTLMTLFEYGVPDDVKNFDGYTALDLAKKYGNEAVLSEAEKKQRELY